MSAPLWVPDPWHKEDTRTQRLVELGTSLFYIYKSFRSLQKSGETDRRTRCCPAQGRMLPRLSPPAQRGENTQFHFVFPQGLVPGPAASAGAEGPGSSSCTQLGERQGRERGSEQQGEGPRLLGQVPASSAGPSTAAPSPGRGKSRRKEPGATGSALGAQPGPAVTPRGPSCPLTGTGPPVGARPGSWPEGTGAPGGFFQSLPREGGKGKRDAPALP